MTSRFWGLSSVVLRRGACNCPISSYGPECATERAANPGMAGNPHRLNRPGQRPSFFFAKYWPDVSASLMRMYWLRLVKDSGRDQVERLYIM